MTRPKRKSNVPTNKVALAQLGLNVSQNWTTEFPSLQVHGTDPRQLSAQAQQLSQLMTADQLNKSNRKGNAINIKAHNAIINKAVIVLKRSIKAEFPHQNNWDNEYLSYGLVKSGNTYILPADNTKRVPALQMLVAKLNEAANPFANKAEFGLAEWTTWQQKHLQLWQNSNQLRQEKSGLLIAINGVYPSLKKALSNINKTIDMVYDGNDAPKQKRTMGFLKESL